MKVFFSMSFRGDIDIGRKIYRLMEELGHAHTSNSYDTDTPENFYKWSNGQRLQHYEEVFNAMHKADIAVLECSIHSLTIGQMIQDCLDNSIPLLILVQDKQKLAFLDSLQEDKHKLLICEYRSETLKKELKEGIEYLSSMQETRFTMILPNPMIRFLDEVNRTQGISRSEFIRDLIQKEMERR